MPEVKRKYVIPGELITEGNYRPLANVIKRGNKFYSTRIGLAEFGQEGVRVIPLSGPYIPRVDDLVIGKIVDYSAFVWEVDINSCFMAYLPAKNVYGRNFTPGQESLVKKFDIGDLIAAVVTAFDRTRDPILSVSGPGLGKITKGEVVKIAPTKVPRLIGKKGSMIRTIESGTGCKLTIGQNGVIVVVGRPEGIIKAVKAIKLVEEEAHLADLTQKVQAMLGVKEVGGQVG
ncbi:MAG: RNA-binding protein [Thaumarchaeota archaeon]|jgi:exosome complex component RRP4|nr:RNA-binding protein [Nitrososphaerota archaeon]